MSLPRLITLSDTNLSPVLRYDTHYNAMTKSQPMTRSKQAAISVITKISVPTEFE